MSSPIRPGTRARCMSGGPTITTRNSTRNSHALPSGAWSVMAASEVMSDRS